MAYDLQAYVQQTKAVADAGRLLQGLLTEAEATRDYAAGNQQGDCEGARHRA